jgi:hypothetical protein
LVLGHVGLEKQVGASNAKHGNAPQTMHNVV